MHLQQNTRVVKIEFNLTYLIFPADLNPKHPNNILET